MFGIKGRRRSELHVDGNLLCDLLHRVAGVK
jgi:hypothetical protein